MAGPTLRPYQQDQLGAIRTSLLEHGQNRVLIKSPTGTGKTVTFSAMPTALADWLAQFPEGDRMMLVIAHREELLDQAAAKIQAANPGLIVMVEQGDRRASPYAHVIVASIQTLSAMKFRRLKKLLQRGLTPRIVVVDEAHHAAASTYRTALVHLGFLPPADASDSEDIEAATHDDVAEMTKNLTAWDLEAPRDRLLVGVTATPNRSDAVGLGCVFQTIAYSYDLKKAIEDGWLVPITPWAVETKTSLDEVKVQRGDFNQRELANAVNNDLRNKQGLAAWQQYGHGRPTLGFTVDVAHAHTMAELFEAAGVRAAAVSGETPKDDRRLMLEQYTNGQLDVLFNCMVLTEGTDLPRTSCILHLKPTKSATLYEQMTGRGLRLFDNKADCVVIDLVDLSRRHSLQAAPVLYGLPPGLIGKGKDLREIADDLDDLLAKSPGLDLETLLAGKHMTLEQLGAFASQVNIWAIPSLGSFGEDRQMRWLKVHDACFRLQYPWADGTEVLEVQKNLLDTWDIVLTVKPSDHAQPKRQRTLAAQIVTETAAADVAEAFVMRERRSVMKLKDKNAPWRSRPASPKQLQLLQRIAAKNPGLTIPKGCTMGQASDLIDIAQARRGR